MSDQTKPVALPAYLPRRLQAFRIVRGDQTQYLLRDKFIGTTHDLEQWQFFVLEVLPGCDNATKLLSVFADRFGREITEREVLGFFAELADRKLLDDEAAKHPLLKPFTEKAYALDKGVVKPRSFDELAQRLAASGSGSGSGSGASVRPPETTAKTAPAADEMALPAGVNDADDLDPRLAKRMLRILPLRPVVGVLLPVLDPLKYGIYLLPLVTLAAVMLASRYAGLVVQDLQALRGTTTLLVHAAFSLLTINLITRVTQALIAHKYRGTVGYLGLGLRFGFFPRFMADIGNTAQMTRRERMWIHGGPLLMRVVLFCIGTLVWFNARDSHPTLSTLGIGLAFLCAVNLLLEGGNPLVKGNSYHLLAAFMDEPHLRAKSYKAFMDKLRGGASTEASNSVLAAYALASFVYAYLVVLIITFTVSHFLLKEVRIGGAAIIIGLVLGTYLTVRTVKRINMISSAYERSVQFDRWRKRALPAEAGEIIQQQPAGSRAWSFAKRALPLTLLLLLFLPYPYQAGGDFQIFPSDRQVLTTDIPGIIEEVAFDGGEAVKKGTVIAKVAATDLNAQLVVYDAKLAEQASVIADLKAKPKPEEVALSTRELEVTRTRARFSAERVPRYARLYADKVISFEEFEAARKELEVDQSEVAMRVAALMLVQTGTPPDRIAAEEAKLKGLSEERNEIAGRVARTVMKMPFDGNILSLHLKQRLNSVLDRGQPFATVESTGTVTTEIEVPETDIGFVKLGAPVKVRPNAFFERTFDGRVQTIDGNVTAQSFGKVVKVIAVVDNPGGELKTGMTGYAKVDAGEMPVWKAFSLALIRFVSIQVWSWVP